MAGQENRTGIGCTYWNIDGQLTHPELVTKSQLIKDRLPAIFEDGPFFERWTEITQEEGEATRRMVMEWLADHDLSTRNQLETIILFQKDEDLEAIAITTMVFFPFPSVAGVRVFVDTREGYDIDLLDYVSESNLDHYAENAAYVYPCPELDPVYREDQDPEDNHGIDTSGMNVAGNPGYF